MLVIILVYLVVFLIHFRRVNVLIHLRIFLINFLVHHQNMSILQNQQYHL